MYSEEHLLQDDGVQRLRGTVAKASRERNHGDRDSQVTPGQLRLDRRRSSCLCFGPWRASGSWRSNRSVGRLAHGVMPQATASWRLGRETSQKSGKHADGLNLQTSFPVACYRQQVGRRASLRTELLPSPSVEVANASSFLGRCSDVCEASLRKQ